MADDEPKFGVKGTHVIQAQAYLDHRLGAGAFAKLAATDGWERPSPLRWYPVETLWKIYEAAAPKVKLDAPALSTEIARLNANNDLKTIYRFFMSVLGPVNVLKRGSTMFRTYVNFGEALMHRNDPGITEGSVVKIPRAFAPWIMAVTLGFLPSAIVAAGLADPVSSGEIIAAEDDQAKITYSIRYR